jgi:asparagine synthetase A
LIQKKPNIFIVKIMSGGAFEYRQHVLEDLAEEIREAIFSLNHDDTKGLYTEETMKQFEDAIMFLKIAYKYVERIDWLLSADDGEETFHERLAEDLASLVSPFTEVALENVQKKMSEGLNL